MFLINNKKGFAIPVVLGVFVFVLGLVAGLFVIAFNLTYLVSADIERSEESFVAKNQLNVFLDYVSGQTFIDVEGEDFKELLGSFELLVDETKSSAEVVKIKHQKFDDYYGFIVFGGLSNQNVFEENKKNVSKIEHAGEISFLGTTPINEKTSIQGDVKLTRTTNIVIDENAFLLIEGNLKVDISNGFIGIEGKLYVTGDLIIKSEGDATTILDIDAFIGGDFKLQTSGNGTTQINLRVFNDGEFTITSTGNSSVQISGEINSSGEIVFISRGNSSIQENTEKNNFDGFEKDEEETNGNENEKKIIDIVK